MKQNWKELHKHVLRRSVGNQRGRRKEGGGEGGDKGRRRRGEVKWWKFKEWGGE